MTDNTPMSAALQRMIAQRRLALVTERTRLRPGNEAPADGMLAILAGAGVSIGRDMAQPGGDWSLTHFWPMPEMASNAAESARRMLYGMER